MTSGFLKSEEVPGRRHRFRVMGGGVGRGHAVYFFGMFFREILMKERQEILVGLLGRVFRYLEEAGRPGTPVVDYQAPESLRQKMDLTLGAEGLPEGQLLQLCEDYLQYSVRTGHRFFMNQLFSGFNFPAFLGEIVTAATNGSMYTYETAPVATLVEMEVVRRMGELAGFQNGNGLIVTGGSNANLVALLCARHHLFPDIKAKGIRMRSPMVIFVSDQAHYSFFKAANVVGIGSDNVVLVKSDRAGCMIPEELDGEIRQAVQNGKTPFFVGATAGTTVMGSFDPLPAIAGICETHGLWFHVDASLGGGFLLSPRHRDLLKGCNLADSFTWDAHKLMGIPLMCSVLLTQSRDILYHACSSEGGDYLFHDYDNADFDLGTKSLQCARRVDALKLWLAWKCIGDRGYAERIDRLVELAGYATHKIASHPQLELMRPVQSIIACFRYRPEGATDLNGLNLALRERLATEGKVLINYTHLNGEMVLRLVVINPDLTERDLDTLFETIVGTGEELALAAARADEKS